MGNSAPLRLAYGFLIFIAFILTLVAMFTPGWRNYKGDGAPMFGVVTYDCGDGNRRVESYDCGTWARSKYPFERATLALLIIAAVAEFLALGCFFALFSPRLRLHLPAFSLCAVAFICVFSAVIVYGVRNDRKIAYMISQSYELLADVDLGYSYWIAVATAILLFFATAVAAGVMNAVGEMVQ